MRREIPPTLRWVVLAVLGLLIAIAVGIAASELTSRRIGLSSEPIRAGDALAPAREQSRRDRGGHRQEERSERPRVSEAPQTEAPPPATSSQEPASESGESGEDD